MADIDPGLKDDPREVVIFNRYRDIANREVMHQSWGCVLWGLERQGKITLSQRKAGDAYGVLTEQFKTVLYGSTAPLDERQKEIKLDYAETQALLRKGDPMILRAVDETCLQELAAVTQRQLSALKHGLDRLEIFFRIKNK
jgi:hypothetical protein